MSAAVRLNKDQIKTSVDLFSVSGLSDASAVSVANTLSKLYGSSTGQAPTASLVPSHLILLSAEPRHAHPPSPEIQEHLRDLIVTAHEGAAALCCGSILAGQGSETDEYGDIAIWLGDGPYGDNAPEVLAALGLERWVGGDSASTIGRISLSPTTGLPESLRPPPPQTSVNKLEELLSRLENKYAFFVKGGPSAGGAVLQVLLGYIRIGEEGGWGGIMGVGVWAD
ncbi:hypothetical protein GLOTRDRAFT_137708 [Gloeophyllum trabeum ATCC 11539]|uniref:Uncharacterized protein n=1 Tax=Gloeophyllum trabeum (strain ATCC 11539 / FP-39264 / Madison 617) TaxID=670483 RepID=S7QDG1_GLOTA|nr:uncharacterized protein GLOTRDRAFT_137708 [Gloeophyllum trabeum ATCC 11539]EPQ57367.1 hypothetical protein GLOTRDRAFT_137708 [Gloeophyllum trabeum ATCC 11539]